MTPARFKNLLLALFIGGYTGLLIGRIAGCAYDAATDEPERLPPPQGFECEPGESVLDCAARVYRESDDGGIDAQN